MVSLRADKALGLQPEIGTRNRAENLLEKGLVRINGRIPKSSYKISIEDRIIVELPCSESVGLVALDLKLDILFEDQDILVINKPAGLVVHPAAGHESDTLVNALVHHTSNLSMKFGENRPGIVHRLDKETSGVLVVAKNDFAHEALTQQFKNRSIHRIYFAACFGCPTQPAGKIQSYLARHPSHRKKYASVLDSQRRILRAQDAPPDNGKWAVTNFTVIENLHKELSLIRLKLETGRTHQIRIHLSEMGNPILGDSLYGAEKKMKSIKSLSLRSKISEFPRFALHAAELGFSHPRSGNELMFTVAWPGDLRFRLMDLGFKEIR